ncbi:MAG TPA: response regulator [Desulfovibrio sp.]|nr:response regulator [Desulfovibrio sp.]
MDDYFSPNLKVLVAEDSAPVRLVIKTYLGKLGIVPHFAEHGRQALNMLGPDNFDMVFMDVHMPEVDGLEAVAEIRKKGLKIPVIAMTTADDPEIQQKCLQSGYDDFLFKPITKEDIFRTLLKFFPEPK